MKTKDEQAQEYGNDQPLFVNEYVVKAFGAGWEAALDYYASLPFDVMLNEFQKYLEGKEKK